MATIYQVTRRTSGNVGPPASLRSGQMFYNMVDGKLYIGFGDNGSGVATSIKVFAQDNFTGAGSTYTEGNGIDITGGTISVDPATIPNIAAGKISGTFGDASISDVAASKLTGTIDPARLPVLPGTVQIVSSGGIANLTAPQQAEIGDGSVVTTTDGRRWIYTGSGSKTAEASYIEMADVTPEWTAIANKPAFATVATSGSYTDLTGRPTLHAVAISGSYADLTNKPTISTAGASGSYTDLTNKPTLGTMASQNANAVAITGGTIDGVILDGGTL